MLAADLTEHGTKGRRILIVDDHVDAATMLAEMFRARGHEVVVAHEAETALELFPRFRPQIALLDIGLPEVDGYELARRMIATVSSVECKLVAVTGYGQQRDKDRSAAAGFSAHLVKPVSMATLLATIADPTS